VASIDVHGNVGQVKALESVGNALTVAGSRVLAGLQVGVGDEIRKRIGLDDESNGSVRVLLEDGDDCWYRSDSPTF
jgi:hypothetical protein